jgi:ubiquinone/menaquinone biosynthesis C-methylase UbiE
MNYKPFQAVQEELNLAGWCIPKYTYNCLSDYEKKFIENEFTGINSKDYYQSRLRELGFIGHTSVLDVGCGMGQWSIAMAELNMHVTGADINIGRLLVAKDIATEMAIKNVEFEFCGAERSPFADDSFDAVLCYGVFMFTHMPSALSEFYRVLKPGGRLYLNVNSLGWYLHLLIDRGLKKRDYGMVKTSLLMLLKTWLGKQQNVMVSPKRMRNMLERTGFQIMGVGPEGTITTSGAPATGQSKYPADFYGYPAVTEVLACKTPTSTHKSDNRNPST